MNYKKVNWYFLGVIMLHLAVVGVLIALQNVYQMGMAVNLLVSELILAVPAVIALLASKEKPNRVLGFHKLKISSLYLSDAAADDAFKCDQHAFCGQCRHFHQQ